MFDLIDQSSVRIQFDGLMRLSELLIAGRPNEDAYLKKHHKYARARNISRMSLIALSAFPDAQLHQLRIRNLVPADKAFRAPGSSVQHSLMR